MKFATLGLLEPHLFHHSHTTLQESWELTPQGPKVHVYQDNNESFWMVCDEIGALGFSVHHHQLQLLRAPTVSPARFRFVMLHNWLPLVYNAWGYQVFHASAVCHLETQRVFVFFGDSGAGKSTLAYALGEQEGWQQLSDDAFAVRAEQGRLQPVPLPALSRLRSPSAAFFQSPTYGTTLMEWPSASLELACFCQLSPSEQLSQPFEIVPMDKIQAYLKLLSQAFVFDLEQPQTSQSLLHNALQLVGQHSFDKLLYVQDFGHFPQWLTTLKEHLLQRDESKVTVR
ncbi:MAG: hypothetical protein EP343_14640 [Deltaproteobacteria bacterium]|nr:MAG: hypothetical protein EP343_14640 [Deltaproteobacteria bacterium]